MHRIPVLALALSLLLSCLPGPARAADEPVVLTFGFVGCNRLDKKGVKATNSASTANEMQLLRTLADVGSRKPAPQYLFLAGDIVKAKKPGDDVLKAQLKAWRALVKGRLPASTRLVAFTGNHELLKDAKPSASDAAAADDDEEAEVPNQPAYVAWPKHMTDYIAGQDGPRAGEADALRNDESRLSYTFMDTASGTLFIVLNTDSQIDDTSTGRVALNWLTGKLQQAQADASVKHIFVMGHKPIEVPGKTPDSGASNISTAQGAAFYALLNQGAAGAPTKVRAYLAAHAHQWSYTSSLPLASGASGASGAGSVPQIIAGNGGSPPEGSWTRSGNYFGYTLVQVTAGGQVMAQSYGRPIPAKHYYDRKPAAAAATPRGEPLVLKP